MTKLYNKKQFTLVRRKLRNTPILCEKLLWKKLRRQELGVRFRRQYGIGNYIVDFCSPEIKLIVEIDGATHGTDTEVIYDNKRQKYLEDLGFTVKRYLNVDVKENFDAVITDLVETISLLLKKQGQRAPSPL